MGNPEMRAMGSWARQSRYLGLGTEAEVPRLTMGNLEMQAVGSWARQSRYLGLGT